MAGVAPRVNVPRPTLAPRPWGLLTAATVLDVTHPSKELNGVEWEPAVCDPANGYAVWCEEGDRPRRKDEGAGSAGPTVEADPFVVYATYACSTLGRRTYADARERVTEQLTVGSSYAVEQTVMVGDHGNAPTFQGATDFTPAAGALNAVGALATLEQVLAENYLGVGVIHVPPAAATYLVNAGLLTRNGTRWTTTGLGTNVAIGAGYSANVGPDGNAAAAGEAWLYATGQVVVRRGPVMVNPDDRYAFDQLNNNDVVVAEREFVVGWECLTAAVRMDLSCCC